MIRSSVVITSTLAVMMAVSGCSAVMALKQPGKKELQVLTAGASRENVIAYLGPPATTDRKEIGRVDIYQFDQGYSGGAKAARATLHFTMDVLTLFIWELIGMPAEAIADGQKMTVKVVYDQEDRVTDFINLRTKDN